MSKSFLTAALFALSAGTLMFAQAGYKAPKTPWGDPDLSGVYSNDDETGTPIERPAVFEGRRQEDITPAELKQINQQRNEQSDDRRNWAGSLALAAVAVFDLREQRSVMEEEILWRLDQ